jgi:hypothetical protein
MLPRPQQAQHPKEQKGQTVAAAIRATLMVTSSPSLVWLMTSPLRNAPQCAHQISTARGTSITNEKMVISNVTRTERRPRLLSTRQSQPSTIHENARLAQSLNHLPLISHHASPIFPAATRVHWMGRRYNSWDYAQSRPRKTAATRVLQSRTALMRIASTTLHMATGVL